jgi:hypothetical protein
MSAVVASDEHATCANQGGARFAERNPASWLTPQALSCSAVRTDQGESTSGGEVDFSDVDHVWSKCGVSGLVYYLLLFRCVINGVFLFVVLFVVGSLWW